MLPALIAARDAKGLDILCARVFSGVHVSKVQAKGFGGR
jgi:hypothetical protein